MIAIIGGRGEGKSALLQLGIFNDEPKLPEGANFKFHKTTLSDETIEDIHNGCVHISQGSIEKITKDKEVFAKEINTLLDLKAQSFTFDPELIKKAKDLFSTYLSLEKEIDPVNKETIENEIERLTLLIKNLSQDSLKEQLNNFKQAVQAIQKSNQAIQAIQLFQLVLEHNIKEIYTQKDLLVSQHGVTIPLFTCNQTTITEKLNEHTKNLNTDINKKREEQNEIRKSFEAIGYQDRIDDILNNIDKYEKEKFEFELKLTVHENKTKKFKEINSRIKRLHMDIDKAITEQKTAIQNTWDNLLNDQSSEYKKMIADMLTDKLKITLKSEIIYKKDQLIFDLIHTLDRRSYPGWENEDYAKIFLLNDSESYIGSINSIFDLRKDRTLIDDFFKTFIQFDQYIKVIPTLFYDGKPIQSVSAGQRGTAYLLLKLATNTTDPIIFDQPEDNLDNSFIVKHLVELFKKLKRHRQIIVVSHNANVVVNSDVEQVIIAKNTNQDNQEQLSYTSGSLENPDIKKAICEILEGGKEAFDRRRKSYDSTLIQEAKK